MAKKLGATSLALGMMLLGLGAVSTEASAKIAINADFFGTGDSDVKDSKGELNTQAYGLNVNTTYFSLGYKRTDYDFSGVEDFGFDGTNAFYGDVHYTGFFSNNLTYSVGLTLGSFYETDADLSDSYVLAPRAILGYRFTNGMTGFLGAYANFNGAENVYLPIIGLKLGDESDYGWSGSIAYPATRVQYRFSPLWAVDATFLTVRDTYHLDDDHKRGLISDGYIREKSYGASLGVTVNPLSHLQLSAGLFSYFDREFELYDKDGDELGSFETDPTYGAYFRGSLVF